MTTVDALVERGTRRWGRLAARPELVDPLDAYSGIRRWYENFRLKEWVGFTLIHPDWAASMIIQDAKYLATSELYAARRSDGGMFENSAAGRGKAILPTRLLTDGRCAFEADGYRLEYVFDQESGRHRIMINTSGRGGAACHGELELDASRSSAPLAVSSPLRRRQWPSGASMFTYKAIFPVSGELEVDGNKINFDGRRDFAIIDEHRSHLTYLTDWTWGTFATRRPNGLVGANFAARSQPVGSEEESCSWIAGGCEPLSEITFTALTSDRLSPVRVVSADGRLDLIFTPGGRKVARHQFVIVAMDYFQEYGSYRGTVRGLDGTSYPIEDAPGVFERMRARF